MLHFTFCCTVVILSFTSYDGFPGSISPVLSPAVLLLLIPDIEDHERKLIVTMIKGLHIFKFTI